MTRLDYFIAGALIFLIITLIIILYKNYREQREEEARQIILEMLEKLEELEERHYVFSYTFVVYTTNAHMKETGLKYIGATKTLEAAYEVLLIEATKQNIMPKDLDNITETVKEQDVYIDFGSETTFGLIKKEISLVIE